MWFLVITGIPFWIEDHFKPTFVPLDLSMRHFDGF